jgi:hypothetical protein
MRTRFQDIAHERRIMQTVREASGDAVWIVDGRTRETLAKYRFASLFKGEEPRWRRRVRPNRYELQTPHGLVRVKNQHGAWFVTRDGAFLVHAPDGRDAIFVRLDEAQAAAELHAKDGDGTRRSIDDDLCWESDH